jgi:hypothetical protein
VNSGKGSATPILTLSHRTGTTSKPAGIGVDGGIGISVEKVASKLLTETSRAPTCRSMDAMVLDSSSQGLPVNVAMRPLGK